MGAAIMLGVVALGAAAACSSDSLPTASPSSESSTSSTSSPSSRSSASYTAPATAGSAESTSAGGDGGQRTDADGGEEGGDVGPQRDADGDDARGYAINGPLHVDPIAGLVIASGTVELAPSPAVPAARTLLLDARNGRLVDVLPYSPRVAVDPERSRVVLDQPETGLSVYDVRSRAPVADFALPTAAPPAEEDRWSGAHVDPIVDPRDGTIYVARGAHLLVVDPDSGAIIRTFEEWFPDSRNTIGRAVLDPSSRTLYLAALDLVTPAYAHAISIVGRSIDDGSLVLEDTAFDSLDALVAWDGRLLVIYTPGREYLSTTRLWRDGRNVHGIGNWWHRQDGGSLTIVTDASSRRLLMPVLRDAGNTVFAALNDEDSSFEALVTAPSIGRLEAFDPLTERLYFVNASSRLDVVPMRDLAPPTPAPAATPAPLDDIRLELVLPGTPALSRRFGYAAALERVGDNVFTRDGADLMYSENSGHHWEVRQGGIPSTVELRGVTVSPNYVVDENVFAIVSGLGIFRSTDGGRWWRPSSSGLDSMGVTALRISPSFPVDRTLYAETDDSQAPMHLWRSRDSGDTWQAIGDVEHLALSPNFAIDQTLYGFEYKTAAIVRSEDGGESWNAVGRVPAADDAVGGELLAIRDPSDGSTILLAHILDGWGATLTSYPVFGPNIWRSADGGRSWTHVLDVGEWVGSMTALSGPSEGTVVVTGQVRWNVPDETDEDSGYSGDISDIGDHGVFRSMDAGATWERLVVPESFYLSFTPLPDGRVMFRRKGGGDVTVDVLGMAGVVWEGDGGGE